MIKKINLVVIFIIIILYSILIGTPLNDNITIPNIVIIIYSVIYIGIRKIKNKEEIKVVSSKIDLFILLLCISSSLSLLLNKSITITGSLNAFTRYLTIFSIYTLVKLQIKDRPSDINNIINAIIISGIIIFTIGIDNLTYNFLENGLSILGVLQANNEDFRFISNFAYANTAAVSMVILFFLSIYQYKNKEKTKNKYVYAIISFFALIGLVLSSSRAVWILFALTLIIYFIFDKNKKISIYLVTGIFAIIYCAIFLNLRPQEMYLLIYVLLIIFSLLIFVVLMLIDKIKFKKLSLKNIGILVVILFIAIIILYQYGLTKTEPLVLFESVYSESEYEQVIRNIEPNKEYNFNFNIEAISRTETEPVFSITIIERNEYDDEIVETTEEFNNYNGKININLTTKNDTTNVIIHFEKLSKAASKMLEIKNLYINDQEIVLKYQFLPKVLVDRISSIDFSNKSVWERFVFIEDGIKILKDHWIIGIGRRWI